MCMPDDDGDCDHAQRGTYSCCVSTICFRKTLLGRKGVYRDTWGGVQSCSRKPTVKATSRLHDFAKRHSEVNDSATPSSLQMTVAVSYWTLTVDHAQPTSCCLCYTSGLTKWQGLPSLSLSLRTGSDAQLAQPRNQRDLDKSDGTSK